MSFINQFRRMVEQLDHLDPMPWNQAILLGVGITVMLSMVIFGSFVD